MKVLILTSIVSSGYAYARGDTPTLTADEAARLINGGFAIKYVTPDLDDVATWAEDAGYTLMASPSGTIPPSGGYYFSDDDQLVTVHPSGAFAFIDPLHLTPGY
jgi:hypothetical protein